MLQALALTAGVSILVAPYLNRDSFPVRALVIGVSFVVAARYFVWRVFNLPSEVDTWVSAVSWAVFALEAVATWLWVQDFLLLKRTKNRSDEATSQLDWYGQAPPRVDVLIASYNESWEVLEKTIVGARNLDYPNFHVWLLDDGNRAWLREKAEQHGVGYVTRTNNQHYKAGNLNNGLAELRRRGVALEFVALLDADFIAWPTFLRRTMALMKSGDVGIVQTPQCFYNADPHQQAFGGVHNWPDEQRGWFDTYLPALEALGWASCCGTSCLIRVAALDAIGGFPTASVCEDTLSSMKMGPKGFRTVYLHERLTVGLAPEGIGEFMTQRARWLLGGVQNGRYLGPGPGVSGRINYWLGLWRLAIWGSMPLMWVALCIVYSFTGVTFISVASVDEAVSFFGPIWLARLFTGWLHSGRQQPFVSDAIWMLLAPMQVRETFRAVLGFKARFKVTDKAQHRDRSRVHWGLLRFHGTLLALLVGGIAYTQVYTSAPLHHEGWLQASTVMSVWFVLVILAGVAPMWEPPKRRTSERYPTTEVVEARADGSSFQLESVDISLGGIRVKTPREQMLPDRLELQLDDLAGRTVAARLVRKDRRSSVFAFDSPDARPGLIRKLYCSGRYLEMPRSWGLGSAFGAFFKWLLF